MNAMTPIVEACCLPHFALFSLNLNFVLQEVMSVEEETTSCYCLLDPYACHILLNSFGTYALIGEPLSDCAVRQLKVAVFGCLSCNSLDYNLRVYCVDNTPCAFQVNAFPLLLWALLNSHKMLTSFYSPGSPSLNPRRIFGFFQRCCSIGINP